MTHTAEKPIQLTYGKLHEKFKSNFPTLLAPLELTKDKLERGEGAQDLADIIKCEVKRSEEATAFVYTWEGQKGQVFECRVLKPFDPKPERQPEAPQEPPEEAATVQETVKTVEATQEDTPAPAEAQDTPDASPEPDGEAPPPTPEPNAPSSSPGLFTALAELIGDSTLLMTLAKHDGDLTVNVMPFGEDKDVNIAAICLTGTPAELDAGFAEAVSVKVEGCKNLAEQIEALKAAEKELADAKKAEVDAKKSEADKKKKEAEAKRKEDEKKKQEEAQQAEKAKRQEALF